MSSLTATQDIEKPRTIIMVPKKEVGYAPNDSTADMIFKLRKFCDEHYPDNLGVQAAVSRFAKAASRPNPLFLYIQEHLKEGFSPAEIGILTAGIAFRVLPTQSELLERERAMREIGLFTRNLLPNLHEETDSHATLFIKSLRALQFSLMTSSFHYAPYVDDLSTYVMLHHILLLRRMGVEGFEVADPLKKPHARDTWFLFEKFEKLCRDYNLPLIHHLRKADQALNPIQSLNRKSSLEGTVVCSARKGEMMHSPLEEAEFNLAVRLAALVPNEFIDYWEGTIANQASFKLQAEYDKGQMRAALDVWTRECNAGIGSHIHGYDLLVKHYQQTALDGFNAFNRHRIPEMSDKQFLHHLIHWSDLHVGTEGVEPQHAKDASDHFMIWAEKNIKNPDLLIDALNYSVDQGYHKLQKDLMDAITLAMAEAREHAVECGKNPDPYRQHPRFLNHYGPVNLLIEPTPVKMWKDRLSDMAERTITTVATPLIGKNRFIPTAY